MKTSKGAKSSCRKQVQVQEVNPLDVRFIRTNQELARRDSVFDVEVYFPFLFREKQEFQQQRAVGCSQA